MRRLKIVLTLVAWQGLYLEIYTPALGHILYIVYDLNSFVVFFGTILGSLLVYFFSNLIGKPSQKFGLPFVVLLRSSLGIVGAKYFGLVRFLVGIS